MLTIHELKCFGHQAGGGNTALVVAGDTTDAASRQQLARLKNLSACVFVDAAPADATGVAYVLDYFYPHTRSPLCLHATLAAAHVLLAHVAAPASLVVQTAMRGQRLTLSKGVDGLSIALTRQAVPALSGAQSADLALAAALLASPIGLASAPAISSVGSPKLLLEVADSATLHGLAPDLERIAAWGRAHGVSGCYVYTRLADGTYEGRNFNHLDPALEDSATGVAAGALTLHLGHGLTLLQGAALGRPCIMRTQLSATGAVLLGGAVEAIATWKEEYA